VAGHDVEWSGDWPEDPGDDEILRRALAMDRVLVTLDKDFGELAIVHQRAHCGIVRLVNLSAAAQGPACIAVFERYATELASQAIITVEPGRVRIRLEESR
jgi:predicted nuclease of predicted toxin-antitoxin system